MNLACSDDKRSTAPAISSGTPILLKGVFGESQAFTDTALPPLAAIAWRRGEQMRSPLLKALLEVVRELAHKTSV